MILSARSLKVARNMCEIIYFKRSCFHIVKHKIFDMQKKRYLSSLILALYSSEIHVELSKCVKAEYWQTFISSSG